MNGHGLSRQTVQLIQGVLIHFPEVSSAVLFGSRAKGTARLGSDIDLALYGEGIDWRVLGRIEDELNKVMPELLTQTELLLTFVKVWLEHNPPLDPALEASLSASADARLERFLDIASITQSQGGLAHLHAVGAEDDEDWDAHGDLETSSS